MEDLKDKSRKYAEEKTSDYLKDVIAQAYADGFTDGYKACQEQTPVEMEINNIEFLDLGLPSGTLWSRDFLRDEEGQIIYLPYVKAKELCIPTVEQLNELNEYCKTYNQKHCYKNCSAEFAITGLSGEYTILCAQGYLELGRKVDSCSLYFWLLGDDDETSSKPVAYVGQVKYSYEVFNKHIGLKLPVLLTKNKQ